MNIIDVVFVTLLKNPNYASKMGSLLAHILVPRLPHSVALIIQRQPHPRLPHPAAPMIELALQCLPRLATRSPCPIAYDARR
jgi:hypothetical protein